MPELLKRDPVFSTSNAMTWWTSTGSQTQPSSLSKNLNFEMAIPLEPCHNKLDFHVNDQNSASTHSPGQSYSEVECEGERKNGEENISFKESGYPLVQGKAEEGYTKSTLTSHDYTSPRSHFDYGQPIGPVSFTYPTSFYPGMVAAYGPHAMVHKQMMCATSTRVPLPLDLPQDEPLFVNSKQFHAILRRRQYRAKHQSQNKVLKDRKPYLHESRHRHALNRARGPGGRFLNAKKVQESNRSTSDCQYTSGFGSSQSTETRNCKETNPATGSSGITCSSNADTIYHQQEYGFSVYASPDYGGSTRYNGGGFHGGTHHFLSVPP